ncbi:MAG TPA: bifunctional diaminohydroxyphosphoribosylaminopyrimidine deaminase/5-amino-6-(5-phosphoribosylamino)uracil reductase RibD [Acetobacteraceae bacterium]|nr:bifunctional diaminohydroxyphosphoribosylaminopyrimidine deaminase/5-amino-6-(5-phosphoribosylamino)uracil reductase RibD [Acetobacteraceae bacterium]
MDTAHMRAALGLARRGLGVTWPNPNVGCVLVREGRVVGRGMTAPGGRPHAETVALAMAGERARGATAYVTLEPCSHHGATPPCAEALIEAGVARVVAAQRDPDPRVNGAGLTRLAAAGITAEEGLLGAEAEEVTAGFLSRVRKGRPALTLKLAATLDGRIATHGGESRWITGEDARRAAHAMRGRHDAVLIGIGTVLADDPELTCRLPGYRARPLVRVIADSGLRLPLTARLVATARDIPTWVLHREGADRIRAAALAGLGVRLFALPSASIGIDLSAALAALGAAGLTSVLAEGGAGLAAGLLRADLVDRLAWFHAPALLGADGWPAAAALGITELAAMPRFRRLRSLSLGVDVLTEFVQVR